MQNLSTVELLLSFIFTWFVILVPPALIRIISRKPLGKTFAICLCVFFYLVNIFIFVALGSQNKSHTVLMVGAWFSYYVFRWQTKASAARMVQEQRKAMGYDGYEPQPIKDNKDQNYVADLNQKLKEAGVESERDLL